MAKGQREVQEQHESQAVYIQESKGLGEGKGRKEAGAGEL